MNVTELCVNCKQNNRCTMCWKTSNKKCPHFIQKTNADRIRAMSDEELADVLREFATKPMQGSFLEWLQKPAEGE